MRRLATTWSEVSRGVPRSPNRYLDQLGVFGQLYLRRLEIEFDGFLNVFAGLFLGVSGGSAAGQFRAYRGVTAGLWIEFENDSELHSSTVTPRRSYGSVWPE